MTVTEIINIIHAQCIENEVFELLTQWMIEDRYNKMVKIEESKAIIRAIHKTATQNKNLKQAIDGIISLSGSKVGVNVNKEELVKALQYDRGQYTKGYADCKNDVLDKIRDDIKYLHDWAFSREEILRIIDRYKEESEGKR